MSDPQNPQNAGIDSVAALSDDDFAVLNAVYLRKIASSEVVQECSGLPLRVIEPALAALIGADRLIDVGGMVMLTEDGTAAVLAAYTARYAGLRGSPEVEAWYERFESVNAQFLTTISAWQTSGHDEAQLNRLIRLVERQIKALAGFTDTIARYQRYAERFTVALDRVDTGDTDYVTSPTKDSIHNIWFEFHEDILTVLGRPRDVAEQ